ncbi:MAG: hypothetical protein AAF805_14895 [Planctomycetota bacterium]
MTVDPGQMPSDREAALDVAVIRSLVLLTEGRVAPFAEADDPPADVTAWIASADAALVRGALIRVLRRWHATRDEQEAT